MNAQPEESLSIAYSPASTAATSGRIIMISVLAALPRTLESAVVNSRNAAARSPTFAENSLRPTRKSSPAVTNV